VIIPVLACASEKNENKNFLHASAPKRIFDRALLRARCDWISAVNNRLEIQSARTSIFAPEQISQLREISFPESAHQARVPEQSSLADYFYSRINKTL